MGKTLFDKVWDEHVVQAESADAPAVLYIDLHLLHEVSSPQAFDELARRGIAVRRPDRCLATIDHAVPTLPPDAAGRHPFVTEQAERQVEALRRNCRSQGITLHDWDSPSRGIVHVIGPELGATLPGMTIVCGDSHTSTHGAFGALAFGIGTTEVGHVLATQCLLQRRPRNMRITVDGALGPGVSAKDVILHIIGEIGVDGASGHVIEYAGAAVAAMDMEARMTLCNMSIEAGARAGMVAPDDTTFAYLRGRPRCPQGADWEASLKRWRQLHSDADAQFHREVVIDAGRIRPSITYGTNPGMVMPVAGTIPADAAQGTQRQALDYMGLEPGTALLDRAVDIVFIGSCTNARISDLRVVAGVLEGRRVAASTRVVIVPGSEAVRQQAEAEGLHEIFLAAGAEWRLPGCSMCIAMNGDLAQPGQYVVSTSNRNFEGRQGTGARTLLASPRTAAVCAVTGRVSDPDRFLDTSAPGASDA